MKIGKHPVRNTWGRTFWNIFIYIRFQRFQVISSQNGVSAKCFVRSDPHSHKESRVTSDLGAGPGPHLIQSQILPDQSDRKRIWLETNKPISTNTLRHGLKWSWFRRKMPVWHLATDKAFLPKSFAQLSSWFFFLSFSFFYAWQSPYAIRCGNLQMELHPYSEFHHGIVQPQDAESN